MTFDEIWELDYLTRYEPAYLGSMSKATGWTPDRDAIAMLAGLCL